MNQLNHQTILSKVNPIQIELYNLIKENEIDGVTMATADATTIHQLFNNQRRVIMQYEQLKRTIMIEVETNLAFDDPAINNHNLLSTPALDIASSSTITEETPSADENSMKPKP
jgi:hypothetical protein